MRRYSEFWSGRDIARELGHRARTGSSAADARDQVQGRDAAGVVAGISLRASRRLREFFFVKLASRIYKRAQAIFAELVRIGRRYADRPCRPDDSADRSADRVITQAQILLALLQWPTVHC